MMANFSLPSWLTTPTQGRKTSPFGQREAPTPGASRFHQGIDIAAPAGTAVVSALGGTIQSVGFSQARGNYITVNHGGGLLTRYQHLSAVNVAVGNRVSQGQRIGAVGSTGISTGNHLCFRLISNGQYVNPMTYRPSWYNTLNRPEGYTGGGGINLSGLDGILGVIREHWLLLSIGLVALAIFKR